MRRVAIFASGSGTNALQLLKHAQSLSVVKIEVVIVDQPKSPLPELVRQGFPATEVYVVPAPNEEQVLKIMKERKIDWIFLAGYMRIISRKFIEAFSGLGPSRILNIHPSILPAYPGLRSYERAFDAGEEKGGVTIHRVDAGVDTGPILLQKTFERLPNDTLEDFINRGKKLEWQMYPRLLEKLETLE